MHHMPWPSRRPFLTEYERSPPLPASLPATPRVWIGQLAWQTVTAPALIWPGVAGGALQAHLAALGSASAPSLLPPNDQAVLSRPEISEMIGTAFAEAVRPGLAGWVDDVLALFGLPWGFDPATMTRPVRMWHGELDAAVPVAHGRWLAARIPHAMFASQPDAGHAGHFDATPAVLEWLVSGD